MMENVSTKTLAMELAELIKHVGANLPTEQLNAFGAVVKEYKSNGVEGRALKVGATAPAFKLRSTKGEWISSADLLSKGPLVITFYRGGWCPFCSLELRAWERHQQDLQALNATVVAISPEISEKGVETVKSKELSFPVLTDEGAKVCEQFGLVFNPSSMAITFMQNFGLDLPAVNGVEGWELPIPSTFVIGQDGIVRWAFVDADFSKRVEPTEVIDAIRNMR